MGLEPGKTVGKDSRRSAECSVGRGAREAERWASLRKAGERGLDGLAAGPFSATLLHYEAPKGTDHVTMLVHTESQGQCVHPCRSQ